MAIQEMGKVALICGDRNWTDRWLITSWLTSLWNCGYTKIIEGEARGADSIAREEAEKIGFEILNRNEDTHGFPAEWDKYGKAAGPIRNIEMLDIGNPDLVLAFHNDIMNSKGTKHMIAQARRRWIKVTLVKEV